MVKQALIPTDALIAAGGPAKQNLEDSTEESETSEYSGREYEVPTSPYAHVNINRNWGARDTIFVSQTVHGYSVKGVDVVAFVSETARNCTAPYTIANRRKHEILSIVDLDALPGTEASFAACERIQFTGGDPFILCQAYLARGYLVASLNVRAGPKLSGVEAALRRFARVAATALAKTE
jgi:hypothetical protein